MKKGDENELSDDSYEWIDNDTFSIGSDFSDLGGDDVIIGSGKDKQVVKERKDPVLRVLHMLDADSLTGCLGYFETIRLPDGESGIYFCPHSFCKY